jgi:hypothetical protein
MKKFYRVSHNTFDTNGFPWITRIVTGLQSGHNCPECSAALELPVGELAVALDSNKGVRWPDVIGSGDYPLFIVSARVLHAWKAEGVGAFPADRLSILQPWPAALMDSIPPAYFWLHGEQMFGARADFDASGFVDVRFCSTCGRRTDNISATYDRQHSAPWPYVFVEGSWNGANLFTTDISPACFFCTDAIVECARKHRHTNFRFIPVEEGNATDSSGLDYLNERGSKSGADSRDR